MESHLLQMRGLKHISLATQSGSISSSHLLQMRGLKHMPTLTPSHHIKVASFTDAWIETSKTEVAVAKDGSHLLQMRGLKLLWE